MAYSNQSEVVAITGSTLPADTIQAIIQQGDRQIDLRLAEWGLTGTEGDSTLKAASLLYAQAGLLEYGLHVGHYDSSTPDFSSTPRVLDMAASYKEQAQKLLDSYIYINTEQDITFGMRVDGR